MPLVSRTNSSCELELPSAHQILRFADLVHEVYFGSTQLQLMVCYIFLQPPYTTGRKRVVSQHPLTYQGLVGRALWWPHGPEAKRCHKAQGFQVGSMVGSIDQQPHGWSGPASLGMDVSFLAPWAEGAAKDKDTKDESGMAINMLGFIPLFCNTPRMRTDNVF